MPGGLQHERLTAIKSGTPSAKNPDPILTITAELPEQHQRLVPVSEDEMSAGSVGELESNCWS
jgi:hypothetical protein